MFFARVLTLATILGAPATYALPVAQGSPPTDLDLHANKLWMELRALKEPRMPAVIPNLGPSFGHVPVHHPSFSRRPHNHKTASATRSINLSSGSSPTGSAHPSSSSSHIPSPAPSPSTSTHPSSSLSHVPSPAHSLSISAHSSPSSHIPPPAPLSPSTPGPLAFQASYLNPHNNIRKEKHAAPLVWNDTLATYAKEWATGCQWKHSGGPYGENVAAGNGTFTALDGVNMWIGEEASYSSSNPMPSHYTQVVWKGSTQLGCAEATCVDLFGPGSGNVHYKVCEYYPPGNVIGQFQANVEP